MVYDQVWSDIENCWDIDNFLICCVYATNPNKSLDGDFIVYSAAILEYFYSVRFYFKSGFQQVKGKRGDFKIKISYSLTQLP